MNPTLHIAIPAIDEMAFLPRTLEAIERQKTKFNFVLYLCVNQPECWWDDAEKIEICQRNQAMFDFLQSYNSLKINIIDKSSRGNGWKSDKYGVGWARKTLFDHIISVAAPDDLLVSLDADTTFGENYFESVGTHFSKNPQLNAISLPYFHQLTDNDAANRAILRYEIYMRNYLINLFLIDSPYAFTAIGSAIVLKINALRKIGGITPVKSGEDFYLLQKMRKMTFVSNWNSECVYPAARFSSRVFFGTGPAMIKGNNGDWESYPLYHHSLFDAIKNVYLSVNQLFTEDIDAPFLTFLQQQFNTSDLWTPLRKNAATLKQFCHSFHEKADGLRILQYLKKCQQTETRSEEEILHENMHFFGISIPEFFHKTSSFATLTTEELDILRRKLFNFEMILRRKQAEKCYLSTNSVI